MIVQLGKKYQTKGRKIPVEIYSIDNGGTHPVHARMKIDDEDGGGWNMECFTADGRYGSPLKCNSLDLEETP